MGTIKIFEMRTIKTFEDYLARYYTTNDGIIYTAVVSTSDGSIYTITYTLNELKKIWNEAVDEGVYDDCEKVEIDY